MKLKKEVSKRPKSCRLLRFSPQFCQNLTFPCYYFCCCCCLLIPKLRVFHWILTTLVRFSRFYHFPLFWKKCSRTKIFYNFWTFSFSNSFQIFKNVHFLKIFRNNNNYVKTLKTFWALIILKYPKKWTCPKSLSSQLRLNN